MASSNPQKGNGLCRQRRPWTVRWLPALGTVSKCPHTGRPTAGTLGHTQHPTSGQLKQKRAFARTPVSQRARCGSPRARLALNSPQREPPASLMGTLRAVPWQHRSSCLSLENPVPPVRGSGAEQRAPRPQGGAACPPATRGPGFQHTRARRSRGGWRSAGGPSRSARGPRRGVHGVLVHVTQHKTGTVCVCPWCLSRDTGHSRRHPKWSPRDTLERRHGATRARTAAKDPTLPPASGRSSLSTGNKC